MTKHTFNFSFLMKANCKFLGFHRILPLSLDETLKEWEKGGIVQPSSTLDKRSTSLRRNVAVIKKFQYTYMVSSNKWNDLVKGLQN